jgi:glycerophosphoryl diester phosphodiesterase
VSAWPYPRLVAHRGGGSLAPENTLGAIRLGQSLGYRMHEIDVKLSQDGVAMLLHDEKLDRTTNAKGRAADLPWSALRVLDAGSWHSVEFRGEPVPSYEEAVKQFRSKETACNVEIKPTPGFDRETGTRVALETRRLWGGAPVPPLFSSFSFEALMAAKEAAPEIPRGWLISTFTEADWPRLEALEARVLHTNHKHLRSPEVIRELHARGYRVLLYTINEVDAAQRWMDAGADLIVTDNLREFAAKFPRLI